MPERNSPGKTGPHAESTDPADTDFHFIPDDLDGTGDHQADVVPIHDSGARRRPEAQAPTPPETRGDIEDVEPPADEQGALVPRQGKAEAAGSVPPRLRRASASFSWPMVRWRRTPSSAFSPSRPARPTSDLAKLPSVGDWLPRAALMPHWPSSLAIPRRSATTPPCRPSLPLPIRRTARLPRCCAACAVSLCSAGSMVHRSAVRWRSRVWTGAMARASSAPIWASCFLSSASAP